MKVLVFEKPDDHRTLIGEKLLVENLREMGHESILAGEIIEAEDAMRKDKYDLVVFHHSDFSHVDHLKWVFPHIKTAAYSGYYGGYRSEDNFSVEMRDAYDYAFDWYTQLEGILEDLESKVQ